MNKSLARKITLVLIGICIGLSLMLVSTFALFSGSHTLYENRSDASNFCGKCHPDKATIVNISTNAHRNIGCSCHGYNPNSTDLYNINAAHNLTKNIYCTNCHTSYNLTTGNINIHNGTIVANNQSAHYLINNSNKNAMYQRAKDFFN